MTEYSFTFLVAGIDPHADRFEDLFFEAGCDDATLALMHGLVAVCFDRAAKDYMHAVVSAYQDVRKTGATIKRFEPDFLVSKAEIARRASLTPAAISLYVSGQRGTDFPAPCARITSASPLWDWVDVSTWLFRHDHIGIDSVIDARISRTINRFVQSDQSHTKDSEKHLIEHMACVAHEATITLC